MFLLQPLQPLLMDTMVHFECNVINKHINILYSVVLSIMIFFKRWYMNETASNKTPSKINAAILPPGGILRISKVNSLMIVTVNSVREMTRSGLKFFCIPSHIMANEHSPQSMVRPAL